MKKTTQTHMALIALCASFSSYVLASLQDANHVKSAQLAEEQAKSFLRVAQKEHQAAQRIIENLENAATALTITQIFTPDSLLKLIDEHKQALPITLNFNPPERTFDITLTANDPVPIKEQVKNFTRFLRAKADELNQETQTHLAQATSSLARAKSNLKRAIKAEKNTPTSPVLTTYLETVFLKKSRNHTPITNDSFHEHDDIPMETLSHKKTTKHH